MTRSSSVFLDLVFRVGMVLGVFASVCGCSSLLGDYTRQVDGGSIDMDTQDDSGTAGDGDPGDDIQNECVEGDRQTGKTSCGKNDRGWIEQECRDGVWRDTSVCVDDDECKDDQREDTLDPCGLNARGTTYRICLNGTWVAHCDDPDQCTDGGTRPGTTLCGDGGINGRMAFEQLCESGQWEDSERCYDPDECKDGLTQYGETPCGEGDVGRLVQECVEGRWEDTAECV